MVKIFPNSINKIEIYRFRFLKKLTLELNLFDFLRAKYKEQIFIWLWTLIEVPLLMQQSSFLRMPPGRQQMTAHELEPMPPRETWWKRRHLTAAWPRRNCCQYVGIWEINQWMADLSPLFLSLSLSLFLFPYPICKCCLSNGYKWIHKSF